MAEPRTGPLTVVGRVLAGTLSVVVLGTSGLVWYEYRQLDSGMVKSGALTEARKNAPPHLDKSVNLLLIGLDSRKDMDGNDLPKEFVEEELHAGSSEIGGYNTNALIVLHIPANGGKVTALSVPRDDYVQTVGADGKMHKIKEAYGIAKGAAEQKLSGKGLSKPELERQSREAGRAATVQTVQSFLDIPIDHFAEVNLIGFYDIAKAVEPIQVCLNNPVDDPIVARTETREGGGTGLRLPAGVSSLDARQALSFVRQRHHLKNGDLDRTHRQQAFISSVVYKLKQDGVVGDLGRLQRLFDAVKKDVVIDDRWNVLDFAQQAPNLTGGNVEFNTLPITGFKNIGGQEVNTVDPVQIKRIVKQLFGHEVPPEAAPSASGEQVAPVVPAAFAAPVAPRTTTPAAPRSTHSPRAGSPSASSEAPSTGPTAEPTPDLPMQGPAVKAGGIPCVD